MKCYAEFSARFILVIIDRDSALTFTNVRCLDGLRRESFRPVPVSL
jgi:hypothetical protein